MEDRRVRGDLITMYKGTREMERVDREDIFNTEKWRTRGHKYKMRKKRCRSDIKKESFPNRVIETWNRLDEEIVTAKNTQLFKTKLDQRYPQGIKRRRKK